jgi:putative ABC transport system ATP-binding protein
MGATLDTPVLVGRKLSKVYGKGEAAVWALREVDVEVARAEFVAIMGPSGSGKTTLLNCLACLDRPSSGEVYVEGYPVSSLPESRLALVRRRLGFVFQSFNLLPTLDVYENIALPLRLRGERADRERVEEVAELLGIRDKLRRRPAELSGGQAQRVAVARALVARPAVVFADEPTGNLDTKASEELMKLFREGAQTLSQTVVLVTHDPACAAFADRVVRLVDGRVAAEERPPS